MENSYKQIKYIVRQSRLVGSVRPSGAKNSALKLLTASILTSENIEISNYPANLLDCKTHVSMLECLGKHCDVSDETISISESKNKLDSILEWKGPSIRNTLLMLGALVSRTGEGSVPLPGGCQLGDRKFDLHEMVLRKLGADIWIEGDRLCAFRGGKLQGADIHLPLRSTGATENAIISACLAEGVTRVWNPHIRPEIIDLVNFLTEMGAKITIFGQEHIEIEGVDVLSGARHKVVTDNMEAITWLIGSVITGGDIEIIDFPHNHLEIPLVYLRESGAKFFRGENSLIVRGGTCYPIDISTGPYPGINSDMQPLFAVFGFCANGESRIIDLRFPGRYGYAEEIMKMGGSFSVDDSILRIKGGDKLRGSTVVARDLRAGAALTLAGLVAGGKTVINNAEQIDRGYNNFPEKLTNLGATIHREDVKCTLNEFVSAGI